MKEYILLGDSTADLPIEIIKELGLRIIPFSYAINDDVYHYYLDERDGDIVEFYDKLRKGAMPVTSQVNPVMYKEVFEEYAKQGKDVLYLCFSSGLSGSYQTAVMGANMVKEDYPDVRIDVVDSCSASIGEGIFLYQAALKKKAGADIDELETWISDNCHRVSHWFMVEDLFHLKRGGRLSTVEAMVGSALKIKPILSIDEEGKLVVKSKARGVGKAVEYLVSKVVEEGGDLDKLVAVVGHADSPEKANKIKELVIAAGMKEENIMTAPIGPIIGTHVGAGMAAIAFVQQ